MKRKSLSGSEKKNRLKGKEKIDNNDQNTYINNPHDTTDLTIMLRKPRQTAPIEVATLIEPESNPSTRTDPIKDETLITYKKTPIIGLNLYHHNDPTNPNYVFVKVKLFIKAPKVNISPRHVIFVVDTSRSMVGEGIKAVEATLPRVIRQLQEDDLITIITFSAEVTEIISATPKRKLPEDLAEIIHNFELKSGTALLGAVLYVGDKEKIEANHTTVVIFSDGENTQGYKSKDKEYSAKMPASEVIDEYRKKFNGRPPRIFPVGLGNSYDRDFLRDFSIATNSGMIDARNQNELVTHVGHIVNSLAYGAHVSIEIGTQCSIDMGIVNYNTVNIKSQRILRSDLINNPVEIVINGNKYQLDISSNLHPIKNDQQMKKIIDHYVTSQVRKIYDSYHVSYSTIPYLQNSYKSEENLPTWIEALSTSDQVTYQLIVAKLNPEGPYYCGAYEPPPYQENPKEIELYEKYQEINELKEQYARYVSTATNASITNMLILMEKKYIWAYLWKIALIQESIKEPCPRVKLAWEHHPWFWHFTPRQISNLDYLKTLYIDLLLKGELGKSIKTLKRTPDNAGLLEIVEDKNQINHFINHSSIASQNLEFTAELSRIAAIRVNLATALGIPLNRSIDFANLDHLNHSIITSEFPERESIKLNIHSKKMIGYVDELKEKYQITKADTESRINLLMNFVSKKLQNTHVNFEKNAVVDLETIIESGNGVCRHHSLFCAFLLGSLVKSKIFPLGKVTHYRAATNNLTAHSFVVYQEEITSYDEMIEKSVSYHIIDPATKKHLLIENQEDFDSAVEEYNQLGLYWILRNFAQDYGFVYPNVKLENQRPLSRLAVERLTKNADRALELWELLQEKKLICSVSNVIMTNPMMTNISTYVENSQTIYDSREYRGFERWEPVSEKKVELWKILVENDCILPEEANGDDAYVYAKAEDHALQEVIEQQKPASKTKDVQGNLRLFKLNKEIGMVGTANLTNEGISVVEGSSVIDKSIEEAPQLNTQNVEKTSKINLFKGNVPDQRNSIVNDKKTNDKEKTKSRECCIS